MSFVISAAGDVKGANVVNLGHAKIQITSVKLFDSAYFQVNPAHTTPPGTQVYSGPVTSVNLLSSATAEVIFSVEPSGTPRTFRSIGFYDSTGALYCTHVYLTAQTLAASNTESGHRLVVRGHVSPAQGVRVLALTNNTFDKPDVVSSVSALPPVSTVGCVLVTDATGETLHLCSDGTKWTLDGHVVVQATSSVSTVTLSGGKTVIQAPGFDLNVPTTSVGRYVVIGPGQKVARVESITGTQVKLNGSYAWVTQGVVLTIWESYAFRVRTHPDQPNPHPAYLTPATGDARYSAVSHVSDSNPHNQYLSKVSAAELYADNTHLTLSDPHNQYALKSFLDASFLSKLTNASVSDANGQDRFRFNTSGPTYLYGAAVAQTGYSFAWLQTCVYINNAVPAVTLIGATGTTPVFQAVSKEGSVAALTSSRSIYRSNNNGTTWTGTSMTAWTSSAWASWWGLAFSGTHLAVTSRFFVAFTDQPGLFSTSTDGDAWSLRIADSKVPAIWQNTTRKVTCSEWTGSRLIIAGERRLLASSPDGLSWTYQPPVDFTHGLNDSAWPATNGIGDSDVVTACTWNGNNYFVLGLKARVAWSYDFQTWTYAPSLASTTWGNGNIRCAASAVNLNLTLIGGDGGRLAVSNTSFGWRYRSGLAETAWGTRSVLSACYNGEIWLVGGEGGALAWSADTVTWTYLTSLAASGWGANAVRNIHWDGRRFLLAGDNQRVARFPSVDLSLSYASSVTDLPLLKTANYRTLSYNTDAVIPLTDESYTVPTSKWVKDQQSRVRIIERFPDSAGVAPAPLLLANFNEIHVYRAKKRTVLLSTLLVEDAVYEVYVVGRTRLNNSDLALLPNDVNYGSVFTMGGYLTDAASGNNVPHWGYATLNPYFRANASGGLGTDPTGKFTIHTRVANKVAYGECQDAYGVGTTFGRWNDTTTQWTLLGRLGTEYAFSDNTDTGWEWYAAVKRIA